MMCKGTHKILTVHKPTRHMPIFVQGWDILFKREKKKKNSLMPWQQICAWSTDVTSSASSWSWGPAHVWWAADGSRESFWASGPEAYTSSPKERRKRKQMVRKKFIPPKGRGKKSKSLFPYGFGTLHKVHSNSMPLQATWPFSKCNKTSPYVM